MREPKPAGLSVSTEITVTIDITPFCASGTIHEALHAPFAGGAYSYASDGRIMIRVPRRDGDPEQAGYATRLDTYLAEPAQAMGPLPVVELPPAPVYVPKRCKTCDATGRLHGVNCRTCKGRGVVECPTCHNEDDCDDCDSTGAQTRPARPDDDPSQTFECDDCGGTGDLGDPDTPPLVPTRVGPYSIDRRYVALLQTLPGIELDLGREDWFAGAPYHAGPTARPLRFRFDGGEGAIMPLHHGAAALAGASDAHTASGAATSEDVA